MLTTLDTVKDELDITTADDDDKLTRYIEQASAHFETLTGRKFDWEEGITETLKAGGFVSIKVSRRPVDAVTSITISGSAVDSDTYTIDAEAGLIYSKQGWPWNTVMHTELSGERVAGTEYPEIEVVYDGGYVTPQQAADDENLTRTLPFDIEAFVIGMVVARYRGRGRDPSVASEKLGDASVSYRGDYSDSDLRTIRHYSEVF